MAEKKTYEGSCHCGAVRFTVRSDLEQVFTCNCSICSRTGSVLTFAPAADFELLAGESALSDYQFGEKRVHHLFCSTCGIRTFGKGAAPDGTPVVAVNLRCVQEIDLDALTVTKLDGKSI